MALVTLQRSPSPSNDPDEESTEGEDGVDGRGAAHRKRSKSTLERLRKIFSTVRFISKLRPCLSESYFTVKGAALILPHNDLNRRASRKNHGGEIQRHLQSMLYLLRPEDKIKVAIRLENQRDNEHRYIALVSTQGRQDTEESVILGLDCTSPTTTSLHTPATSPSTPSTPPPSPTVSHPSGATLGPFEGRGFAMATIGLVQPIWMGMKVRLNGDGGFSIVLDDKSYLFKPVSVQAMWSAIQSLDKALHQAEQMKYLTDGLTHTWVEYYRSKVDTTNQSKLTAWHLMEDVEIFAPTKLNLTNENETEKVKLKISAKLKEVMMSVDLDEATSRSLRLQVEEALQMKLDEYRSYFDEELIRILGQMDAPSQILDYLYLGSEWNASNLEELQQLGIKYILNITREIDNFFTGLFHYCNVRLYDVEESDLLKHWLKTYKFINKARKHNSKVLVHCKMGISRSASTVIAYLMKENRWSLDEALAYVKERRSCVRPNKGFMEQLHTYEGILNASNKRDIFRSKSEHDILEAESEEGESGQQGTFLGDSLFRMMSGCDSALHTPTPEEEILMRKGTDQDYTSMEPDLETGSRSADSMEESLPDLPSPQADHPTIFVVPPQDMAPRGTSEGSGDSCRLGMEAGAESGASSRIKPDSSWIRLDSPGESTTDPAPAEAMEVGGEEVKGPDNCKEQYSPEPSPPVVFMVGPDRREGSAQPSEQEVDDADSPSQTSTTDIPSDTAFDLGVHQYYSREQIPWNPGKVRNLREEFCASGQNAYSDSSSTKSPDPQPPTASKAESDCKKSSAEAVSKMQEDVPEDLPCEDCQEEPGQGQDCDQAEGMDMDDQSRSVYEREDIPLVPGTVQRTRQEIEERQKLFGEEGARHQSVFTTGKVKRSSSLRDDRESSRTRHSERRKTCPPIVSPPPEKESEAETAGEVVDIGEAVLRLDFEAGESTTDDVEMKEGGMKEKKEGEEEEEVGSKENVAVYTFGEECVPVTVGMVRRKKQEIENKSSEGGGGLQHTLSVESSGSAPGMEDRDSANQWPADPSPATSLAGAWQWAEPDMPAVDSRHSDSPSIPGSLRQWPPVAVPPSECAVKESHSSRDKGQAPGVVGAGQWVDSDSGPHTASGKGQGADCLPSGSRVTGSVGVSVERSRYSSESSHLDDSTVDTSVWKPRPYSHSFPSMKKPAGRSNFDPETLAMIREIGSAFITSPPQREEEESTLASTSLVKHLVKNIEKENRVQKPERKIVILGSSGGAQSKRQMKTPEAASSLYTPSPEFLANIEQQLSQASTQPPGSQPLPADPGGQGGGDRPSPSDSDPPSVVKHLRGRFESPGLHCDSSEGEPSLSDCAGSASQLLVSSGITLDPLRQKDQPSAVVDTGCPNPDSEQSLSGAVTAQFHSSHVGLVSSVSTPQTTSQPPRRPRSAEYASYHGPSPRPGAFTPRGRAAWDREVAGSLEEGEGGVEGVKVRRLHGKSHPLSRLQQQRQGENPYPPPLQRHGPFHSSM